MAQGPGKFGRFLNGYCLVNAVDLSAFVRSITINADAEVLDISAMGDTTRVKTQGFLDWSIDVEFYQSFYTAEVDATLYPLWNAGTQFTITVAPDGSGAAETNPTFSGTAILPSYNPIAGAHGEVLTSTVRFESAGALTRATS